MDYFSIQLLLVITPGGKAMHQSDFCLEKGDCYFLAASDMSMIPSSSMPNNCSGSLLQSLDLTETKKQQTDSTHIEQIRVSKFHAVRYFKVPKLPNAKNFTFGYLSESSNSLILP